jgi:DNA-binding NtrC family response regulator
LKTDCRRTDDEAAIRELVRAVLDSETRFFAEAANGLDAQRLLDREPFDLIITDIIMPDCDGIELLMAIRQKSPSARIIVMSGGGRVRAEHYLDLAEKLGATRIFEKPFNITELKQTVSDLLAESAAGQQENE